MHGNSNAIKTRVIRINLSRKILAMKLAVLILALVALPALFHCNEEEGETRVFQTEVSRLLDIIINSLYSQKEIFLREAISNASDALDKLRFLSIADPSMLGNEPELSIKIEVNPADETIVITDTGLGMTKNDLVNNLGTIARSGTTQFLEAIAKDKNLNLIGQFGVGFYSYFLVADKVTVVSKNNADDQYIWESTAGSTFFIKKDTEGPFLNRGTKITLHLKKEAKEFLDINKEKALIRKYSEFINFPIYLFTSKEITREIEEEKPAETPETKPEEEKKDDNLEIEEDVDKPVLDEKKEKKTVKETVWDWEKINDAKALWLRPIEEIEDEEYKKFYKAYTKDSQDPMSWMHFRAEGEIEFTALLYIPKNAPMDFMEPEKDEKASNMKLYVRRVLISENFKDLLPKYLSFVKGVVDSDDLPLNVSRESLQQMRTIKTIKKKLTKKVLDRLEKYAKEKIDEEKVDESQDMSEAEKAELKERNEKKRKETREMYDKFWKEFGRSIKLGIVEDVANRNKLAELLRVYSTNGDSLISLEEYLNRAKSGQKDIFYLGGENRQHMKNSPLVKGIAKRGYEVLLLDDAIDEYCIQTLAKYKEKNLVNIAKSGFELPLDDDEKDKVQKLKRYYQPLTDWLQKVLAESVQKISVSTNLVNDPMVVLSSEYGYSANFEKIAKAQAAAYKDERLNMFENMKRNVEINPYHPFIKELLDRVKSNPDSETEESVKLMFEIAMLNSGYNVKDPAKFTERFYRVMGDSLGLSRDVDTVSIDLEELDDNKSTTSIDEGEEINLNEPDFQSFTDSTEPVESEPTESTPTETPAAEETFASESTESKLVDEEL
jgi:heat shock protein beta